MIMRVVQDCSSRFGLAGVLDNSPSLLGQRAKSTLMRSYELTKASLDTRMHTWSIA